MKHPRIDWPQLWYSGRRQPFTADEMARAGADTPSPTLLANAGINFAVVAFVVMQLSPASQTARLSAALVALAVLGMSVAKWLWWRPWAKPLLQAQLGVAIVVVLLVFGLCRRVTNLADRESIALALVLGMALLISGFWLLVLWRAAQIEGRLREQSEREKAVEMAGRLATAQMEPHFLFNTLASLQHWVHTKDDRAAPLLDALIAFLRATLPMFRHPLVAAHDELAAVERYLQIMQARMGARLAFRIEVEEDLRKLQLPPGSLLTLVENAVVHGLETKLSDGQLVLLGRSDAGGATFEVIDNGPGPAPDMQDGIGLGNVRQRLALACGPRASLTLGAAPGGGFRAELKLPLTPSESRGTP
jgi:hypothetical protein